MAKQRRTRAKPSPNRVQQLATTAMRMVRTRLATPKTVTTKLAELEDRASANRRDLDLQFKRMAQMQQEIDELKKSSRS